MALDRFQHRIEVTVTLEMVKNALSDFEAEGKVSNIDLQNRPSGLWVIFVCEIDEKFAIQQCLQRLVFDVRFPNAEKTDK